MLPIEPDTNCPDRREPSAAGSIPCPGKLEPTTLFKKVDSSVGCLDPVHEFVGERPVALPYVRGGCENLRAMVRLTDAVGTRRAHVPMELLGRGACALLIVLSLILLGQAAD